MVDDIRNVLLVVLLGFALGVLCAGLIYASQHPVGQAGNPSAFNR